MLHYQPTQGELLVCVTPTKLLFFHISNCLVCKRAVIWGLTSTISLGSYFLPDMACCQCRTHFSHVSRNSRATLKRWFVWARSDPNCQQSPVKSFAELAAAMKWSVPKWLTSDCYSTKISDILDMFFALICCVIGKLTGLFKKIINMIWQNNYLLDKNWSNTSVYFHFYYAEWCASLWLSKMKVLG